MLAKDSVIGKKRYISMFTLLAIGMLSKKGQEQMSKYGPKSIVDPVAHFEYETGVTPLTAIKWPVILCCSYLMIIFSLQAWMKNRAPYQLNFLRIVHNFILCFGSLLMMFGLVKETFLVYQKHGEEALFCDVNGRQKESGNLFFWYYIFFLSKFYEFIDTVILVLRKKELSFLHVFHHFITAILCWVGLYTETSVQWIVVILNATVHIFMYYYYLAATLNSDVWWKKYLTTAQIIQFVIDMAGITVWWYYTLVLNQKCSGSIEAMLFTYFVLGSFLILFIMFYLKTFKSPRTSGQSKTTTKVVKQN